MKKGAGVILTIIGVFFASLISCTNTHAEDTTWQSDWTFTKNTTAKTITLTKYKGSEETYKIPAKAVIDEEEYTVIFGNGSNSSNKPVSATSIKHLSVEEGVKINNPNYLFYQATNLESVDLSGADTSAATSVQRMFSGATNVKTVKLSGLNLSKVTTVSYLFYQATNLEEVDFSDTDMSKVTSFTGSNPSNNTNYSSPFYGANNLKKINFNNFNTASLTSAKGMFRIIYRGENKLESLDVTNWNTAKVTTFDSAFENSANLETIEGIETLNTSSATSFWLMFASCAKLKELPGIGNWDTSKVTDLSSMFSGAKSINNLDLSGWDTSSVTKLGSMFVDCGELTNLNVSTWNTSRVTQMDQIFKGCVRLEVLNLQNWTTESIANTSTSHMNEMFGKYDGSHNGLSYGITPLKEITLNNNFRFISSTSSKPSLRTGYWHLKEGTEEQTTPKFTPDRLYNAYNNGVTPPAGYKLSHTYVLTELDPATASYYAQGWGDNNTWEVHYPTDKFKSYCINLHRGSPSGYYDRTLVSSNSIIDEGFLDSNNYGWAPLGSDMEQALITLIYYGYGNNGAGIQEKYNLTNNEFMLLTQNAIWNFTDRYSNPKKYDGDSNIDKAYRELVSKKFSDIPNNENLKLYLYESIDGKQNLLSISGLSDVAHAGVRVLKLAPATDGSLEPLIGAEFTIYDDDNDEVATIISDENGYATKYNTDSIYGLPEGIYTIREAKAPRGYNKTNNFYSFIVRPADDNEIITIGKLNLSGDDTPMIFENTNNPSVEGGGLIIKIVDNEDIPIPTGAIFEIVDEAGIVINTITTDHNGSFMTGKKDLSLHEKYTARLKEGPAGYISTVEIKSETLTENEQYKTLIFKFIKKTCGVTIEATKLYNGDFSKDKFNFELYNVNDHSIINATNDDNGKIRFDLSLGATNLGYMVYSLREVEGTSEKIIYDTHSAEVTVSVSDQGDSYLVCKVEQGDVLEFTNILEEEDPLPDPIPTPEPDPAPEPIPDPDPVPDVEPALPNTGAQVAMENFSVLAGSYLCFIVLAQVVIVTTLFVKEIRSKSCNK